MSDSLSREDMERIIAEGGSVIYKGAVLSHVRHLPSAATLAAGNAERVAATRRALEAQRDAIDAQLAELDRPHIVRDEPEPEPEPEQEQEQEPEKGNRRSAPKG